MAMVRKIGILNLFASLGWLVFIVWLIYTTFVPISLWLDYANGDLIVADSTARGPSPVVTSTAIYNKTILVRWHRTLLRNSADGDWVAACTAGGEGNRYAGESTPPTTLDNMFIDKLCAQNPVAGDYYIEDDLEWFDLVWRNAVVESNVFTIAPAAVRQPGRPPPPPVVITPSPEVMSAPTHRYRKRHTSKIPWPFNLLFGSTHNESGR